VGGIGAISGVLLGSDVGVTLGAGIMVSTGVASLRFCPLPRVKSPPKIKTKARIIPNINPPRSHGRIDSFLRDLNKPILFLVQ
jgi:hypothetical protein